MPPVTKLWLSVLKDPQSIDSPDFRELVSEILNLCSSYTNPEPSGPQMHVLYRNINNPSQLLMITGYQSQELNTQADAVYAEKLSPRMLQYVSHGWLRQLDIDVRALPLEENILVAYGKEPQEWVNHNKSIGGWDIWPETAQGRNIRGNASGEDNSNSDEERYWVQVTDWNGHSEDTSQPINCEKLYLRKFVGR
jgi:hypothetical protein